MVARDRTAVPAARVDPAAGHGSAAGRGRVRRAWPAPRLAAAVAVVAGVHQPCLGPAPGRGGPGCGCWTRWSRGALSRGATIATAAAGVGLLLLSGGLRRRQRLAWAATVALLAGSAVLHTVKGLDVEEALVAAFLAGLLASQGGQVRRAGRPGKCPAGSTPGAGRGRATLSYGVVGLLANSGDVAEDLSVAPWCGRSPGWRPGWAPGWP